MTELHDLPKLGPNVKVLCGTNPVLVAIVPLILLLLMFLSTAAAAVSPRVLA